MSNLVAYCDETPIDLNGCAEVQQPRRSEVPGIRAVGGLIRSKLVYVAVPMLGEVLLVPFGEHDEWSLRDRYNEALRIVSSLGAATITCETSGEFVVRRGLRARIGLHNAGLSQQRAQEDGFNYSHSGTGHEPRDPRPLRWPDEPGFAAAVSNVLEGGAIEVTINISSTRTHSLDGELGTQLKGLGFDLGGGTERSKATALHIRATFPEQSRGWRRRG